MLVKRIKPDFEFENEIGSLVQLVHEGWKQVNVLKSKKGSTRGGHYHKVNEEAFYIIEGCLKLSLDTVGEHEETEFRTGDMFMIMPYQIHNFEFISDTLMVSMYSKGVEHADGSKDIYTE